MGQRGALLDRSAFEWHKRHHVGGPYAGMHSRVARQVDQLGGPAHAAQGGFGNGFWLACERDDTAIVIRVAVTIEDRGPRNVAHRGDQSLDSRVVPALGKVGNAFNEAVHFS